jgi:hypothetical protein
MYADQHSQPLAVDLHTLCCTEYAAGWVLWLARLVPPLVLEHVYTCVLAAPGYHHVDLQLVPTWLADSNISQ